MSPDTQQVRCLANRQNQPKHGPLGNYQLPLAKGHVSVPASERDSSQGGSSIPCKIQGLNYTPSSSLKNSRIADINHCMTSTLPTTQRQTLITPTATSGTSSHNTPAPSGTIQTDSTRRIVSSPASGIASTPTALSGLENLATPIPNPEARTMITNPLQTPATEMNQRQRKWQLHPQSVSTPGSMVYSSCGIH
jgi:hypothetical protein